jgi:MYXO-CTERM domain-containing protein
MKRTHILLSILLLSVVGFAQPSNSPQDRTTPQDQTYNRPVERGHDWGGWGLLGLFGLAGLLGRRRETTVTGTGFTRDDRTYEEPRRRVG